MAAEHLRRGEVQQRLVEAGWFSVIEPKLAEAVLDAGRQVSFARGASLFQPQGDPGGIYGVVSGGIVISLPGRHGFPAPGHIMRRGDWFGYGAVLFRKSRTLLAEANEPSVLLHVPLAQVDAIRASIPGADLAFTLLAAFGETAILNILADLMIPGAEQRLASVLLRVTGVDRPAMGMVHRTIPVQDRYADPLGAPLTQVLLADLANASRQTAARFVDRATREGWIDWSYGRVRILSPQALADFAAGP
jgi:CRP/FNR family transcriptional regulator, cyclic AMP receptor protein